MFNMVSLKALKYVSQCTSLKSVYKKMIVQIT